MMCRKVQPHLLDFTRHQLSLDDETAIERHLAGCAACRKILAEEVSLAGRLAGTKPLMEPADMWECVRTLRNATSPVAVRAPWWTAVFGQGHARAWTLAFGTTAASLALLFLPNRTVRIPASPSVEAVSALQSTVQTVTQSDDPLGDFTEARWQAVYGNNGEGSI
ncbi:MAG TPA: zf-HC2 domain-containing protein [Armatimonadota bacterium]|nr:zf-HC2 domain-containing protein [Armatimonadota bacterium]